jgi:hypothetical protein
MERTIPAKGSAMGPKGLACTNLAALLDPAPFCKDVIID